MTNNYDNPFEDELKENGALNEEITEEWVLPDYTQGRNMKLSDIPNLLFKPSKFFKSNIYLGNSVYILIMMVFLGFSKMVDQVDKYLLKVSYGKTESMPAIDAITDNWFYFVLYGVFLGAISGGFMWLIYGWWYNLRLKWSVEGPIDKLVGRSICFYNQMIVVVPATLLIVVQMFFYSDYKELYESGNLIFMALTFLLYPLLIYSVVNSYRSVKSVFKVKKGPAMVWFLILPITIYVLTIVIGFIGVIVLAMMQV